jgi:hypothetical protein
MAKGDAAVGLSSVNAAATKTIQPGAGVEWIIHNIYHEAEVELKVVEGATELLFDSAAAKGSWSAYFFHLTNTHYLKVKNTNAGAKLIGYDGIVSKE